MAFVEEAIISGFIGEVVSRCVDFSWTKIKEAVKSRKDNHHNIESQIYNVVVNVLNQITYKKFVDNQDEIYQAAERILRGYKDIGCDSIEVARSGLQILGENVNEDKYIQFKTLLYQELSKNNHEELYHQIRLFQQDKESEKTSRIEQKIDKVQQSVDETNQVLSVFKESNRGVDNVQNKKPVKSRTQEYVDKWEANMFLNDFDKRDENAGTNIKLREVYLEEHLPHYIWCKNNENNPSNDLKELLSEYINKKRDSKMLLILGQPGIGKSTLITWITANYIESIDDILVYRFASDLGDIDWQNGRISIRVLERLRLNQSDLNGKVLIIDGFDEVSIESNRRRDILDSLYGDWIFNTTINNFTLIITCRENYIPQFAVLKCKYITLQQWNGTQIRSFCNIFQDKAKNRVSNDTIEKLCENEKILGIPLILYMVLALNISIEKEGSIVDVYDKIFSLEGGIYDRCIDNKNFANKHRIGEIKEYIHQISRDIAIWMFENEAEKASIPQEEYQNICRNIIRNKRNKKEIEQDFLIGNFFKLVKHCEGIGTEELYFIHRSIYEYFVAETIYGSIEKAIINLSDKSREKFACNIVKYLKRGEISFTIGNFLERKIIKLYHKLDLEKQKIFYNWWEETISRMMEYGMFYFSKKNIKELPNIIESDIQCFMNLLEILRLLIYETSNKKYILDNVERTILEKYIKYSCILFQGSRKCQTKILDLANLSLRNINLAWMDLGSINLASTDLTLTDLTGANLTQAGLAGADLTNAILTMATISENQVISLSKGCNLKGVCIYNEKKDEFKIYE